MNKFIVLAACLLAVPSFCQDDIFEIWPWAMRGDANSDNAVNTSDAIFISNFLYQGGPAPSCMYAADANDDGEVTGADATYIVQWYSNGGPPPPSPGPFVCAGDPTEDNLTCEDYTCPE